MTTYHCSECGRQVEGDSVTVADCVKHPLATIIACNPCNDCSKQGLNAIQCATKIAASAIYIGWISAKARHASAKLSTNFNPCPICGGILKNNNCCP